MSLSDQLRSAAAVTTIIALPQVASAQDGIFTGLEYWGESDYTISIPTDSLLGDGGPLSNYYLEEVTFQEHRASTQSLSFGYSREREFNPGQDGFFTRWGGSVYYSQSSGTITAGTHEFVDHVAGSLSRDIYDAWERNSGGYSDRLTEGQIYNGVRGAIDAALNFLADNPDLSFDAASVDLPDHIPANAQAEIRDALRQAEKRVESVTSSDGFDDLVEFAGYYQDPVVDLDTYSLGIQSFADIGYRDYVDNGIFGMESYEVYAGLSAGYEAHYLDAGDLGQAGCYGATASLRLGGRANFEDSYLSLHGEKPFDIDQDCMGGAVRSLEGDDEWRVGIEFIKEFNIR